MTLIDTEKWREILTTLGQHKLRTSLTAFGVFWGIFMLSVLLGAAKGLENGVMDGFPKVPNGVWVWSGSETQIPYKGMAIGRRVTLRPEDVNDIANNVDSVGFVQGLNSVGIWNGSPPYTVHEDKNGTFFVQGSHEGMALMHSLEVTSGRYLNLIDMDERRKVAVIGSRVKEQLFTDDDQVIGADITINGISFQVIGTFRSLSQGNSTQEEEKIFIPNATLRYAFNQVGWLGSFMLIPKEGVDAAVVEREVKEFLYEKNKIHPDDVGVLGSFNLQQEFDKINGLFLGITFFSWLVAIGTIMAGAIGVGNIMLIVVKERTREIGLRKALGATPASIVIMIVQEAVLITAVAGYLGLVAGVMILELVSAAVEASGGNDMFQRPGVDFSTAVVAVVVLVVSGVLAALLPATKAAKVNPIVALQDE
ncbi:ABC transporter permease [Gilvimarinus sp. SDUM040013]|uniref:ABC transporter permease n=1 Tax=Gilvimarinus gilvus TaxID=3058038 RepID=A0ABU4RXC7_9GAMM|nr:ABC transporter permease [Gilvimarinus sp. SDUM040013]MDO3388646.1 ABC transporter permease [Gilvimarinus sp. SDUM040013]MDX6849541.1 ABC transporter permease [Gilvimarinus sp. SDUM040013]